MEDMLGETAKYILLPERTQNVNLKVSPQEMEELSHSPAFPYTDWHDVE